MYSSSTTNNASSSSTLANGLPLSNADGVLAATSERASAQTGSSLLEPSSINSAPIQTATEVSKASLATAPLITSSSIPSTPVNSLMTRTSVPATAYTCPIAPAAGPYTATSSITSATKPLPQYSAYATSTKGGAYLSSYNAKSVQQSTVSSVPKVSTSPGHLLNGSIIGHYTSSSLGTGYVSGGYSSSMAAGQQQVVHSSSRVDHSQQRVIAERVIEHEVKVPKRITREDVVEKIIVVPEKIVHEEVIEDIHKVRERIVEVAMPVIQEKIVEVPEIEYIEKVVEVPEVIIQEKIREVPRVEYQERIVEVIKPVIQEKIVEVPEIEYRDIPVEKIVEIPEIREQVVIREVPVPQYVEKPVAEYVDVQQEQEIIRTLPIPVEAVTTCEFKLPRLRATPKGIDVPLYVPRFVEVPIPMDVMDVQTIAQAEAYASQVSMLAASSAVSLCDVETIASNLRQANFETVINSSDHASLVSQYWASGRLQVDPLSMCYTTSSVTGEGLMEAAQYHSSAQYHTGGSASVFHPSEVTTVTGKSYSSVPQQAPFVTSAHVATHHVATQHVSGLNVTPVTPFPLSAVGMAPFQYATNISSASSAFQQSPAASTIVGKTPNSASSTGDKKHASSSEAFSREQTAARTSPLDSSTAEDAAEPAAAEQSTGAVTIHGGYTDAGTPINGGVRETTENN